MTERAHERAQHEVTVQRDVRIPTTHSDLTLSGDLFLPVGAGPVPLVVMALPYRKDLGGADLLLGYVARHGYAALIIDLWGTGDSDGTPRVPFSQDDAHDAVAAITWGSEQPWCDGNVGMWGHSYGGLTTMRAAALAPPSLKAIIPIQGLIDPEHDVMHPDGAAGLWTAATWTAQMLGNFLVPPLLTPDDLTADPRWRDRLSELEPYLLDATRTPPGDARWADRKVDASAIEVPALCIVGWRDIFADGQTRAFEAMRGPKRLLAGPWMHVLPIAAAEGSLDFLGTCLDWWDRWLKGIDNGADREPSATYVQGSAGYWARFDDWAHDELTLSTSPGDGDPASLEQTACPGSTDPSVGIQSGLTRLAMGAGLPRDQHDDDLRSECWTSSPLPADTVVIGRPRARVRRTSGERVVVRLAHVDPAGRSVFLTSGVLSESVPLDAAVEAGELVELDVTAYEIPAGHRLRLSVSDADFPRLRPLPPRERSGAALLSATVPRVASSEVPRATLPEEPAYLRQMLLALGGNAGDLTTSRDLSSDALSLQIAPPPASQQLASGWQMASSSHTGARVQPDGAFEVTARTEWVLTRSGRSETRVLAETSATDGALTFHGRVTTGDELVFERTWSSADPYATDSTQV